MAKKVKLIANNRIHLSKDTVVPPEKSFGCDAETAESLMSGARPAARLYKEPEQVDQDSDDGESKDEFDKMNAKKLKKYAKENEIDIPENLTEVEDIRAFVREEAAKKAEL